MIENRFKNIYNIDVLIVGAGINGAGLFRELALQDVNCLLIDKSDFMSGASAAPSRMIHGGLRYLENREVRLVQESLSERNLLLQNAPHYVFPLPTVIPIYHWFSGIINGIRKFFGMKATNTPRGAIIVKLGLLMYDIFTRNQRVVPTHQFSSRKKSLEDRPLLDPNIVCTALFYDAWISFPERLGIELIQDGLDLNNGSIALNYVSLNRVENGQVILKDELSGRETKIKPKVVVNATGAWIDFANLSLGKKTKFIGGTKGSHLMVDNQALMNATMGQMVYYENDEGRICILFPLHGKVMIGSTDIKVTNPDEVVCTDEEVEYMLSCVRQVFPKLDINPSQVIFKYSGVRPLPNSEGDLKNAQISRDHSTKVIEPTEGGLPFPILNLIGGKWTTFRAFGEQTSDKILTYLGLSSKVKSTNFAIGGGKNFPKTEVEKINWIGKIQKKSGLEAERINTLLNRYGTNAEKVIDYIRLGGDCLLKSSPNYSKREIEYLLKNEFVNHLDDLILRRTVIALSGELTSELFIELADIYSDFFQLNLDVKSKEIERTKAILTQKHGVNLNV
jgi:glycerol-3-phosphate dehydrogenase